VVYGADLGSHVRHLGIIWVFGLPPLDEVRRDGASDKVRIHKASKFDRVRSVDENISLE
jgi:hypothetical protein